MKYKLVEFIDGTWGILVERPWWQFWAGERFVDLDTPRYAWRKSSQYFSDCKGDREKAEMVLKRKTGHQYRIVET